MAEVGGRTVIGTLDGCSDKDSHPLASPLVWKRLEVAASVVGMDLWLF